MRKRTTALLLSALLALTTIVSGCGKPKSTALFSWEDRKLNIIEDNYRNYYEIFVRSFYDSDGNSLGDLKGVTGKLDYIKNLGFNGIWLMPIMPSPTYHKYDTTDYRAIDKEYGTMEDFEELIKEAHARGIRVIIDFVMNHSSSKHPWFTKACEFLKTVKSTDSRSIEALASECPYVGYYHFTREKKNGTYYRVGNSDFYYEGQFWSEMPDLNYDCKELRAEFEDIAKFWIDKGVDGFRMDATLHFEEGDTDFNTEVMNWIYTYAKSLNPEFYMVSEVWSGKGEIANYYRSKTDSLFNFDAASAEGMIIGTVRGNTKATAFVNAMADYDKTFGSVYPDYIDAPFLTNHDMGRVCNALNGDMNLIKFAGGLLLSMKGSPFVYYGEEIGMKSKGTKDENKRLPMVWGEEEGMTKAPSGADSGIAQNFAGVAEQLTDEGSILNYYRRALLIRNQNPEIARGTISIVSKATEGNAAAMVKTFNGSSIAILYNNSATDAHTFDSKAVYTIKNELESAVGTTSKGVEIVGFLTVDNSEIKLEGEELTLPARSIVYLKLR